MKKFFLLTLFSFQASALATETLYENNEEIKNILNSNIYSPNYLTMILGLFFVILLIYLTGIIYQKLIRVKLTSDSIDENKIEILSSASLGQGKNLHVVKIGSKKILIGATQNNISYLNSIDDNILNKENTDGKEC